MLYLILCVFSSAAISILFKLSEKYGVKVFHLVVLNYFVAAGAGFAIADINFELSALPSQPWFPMAVIIGSLFIAMFLFIGIATREVGVSVTTVAAKMSVVVPMLFSILYYAEQVDTIKIAGMILAIIAVVLTVYKKSKVEFDAKRVYYPIILFIGAGIIDSLIKFAQEEFLDENSSSVFSGVLFTIATIVGVLASIVRKEKISTFFATKTLLFGLGLGAVNFGSLYFIIMALDSKIFESSIVFGLNNVGVVLVSVIVALLFFSEKLSWINWLGILTSLIAIAALGGMLVPA